MPHQTWYGDISLKDGWMTATRQWQQQQQWTFIVQFFTFSFSLFWLILFFNSHFTSLPKLVSKGTFRANFTFLPFFRSPLTPPPPPPFHNNVIQVKLPSTAATTIITAWYMCARVSRELARAGWGTNDSKPPLVHRWMASFVSFDDSLLIKYIISGRMRGRECFYIVFRVFGVCYGFLEIISMDSLLQGVSMASNWTDRIEFFPSLPFLVPLFSTMCFC